MRDAGTFLDTNKTFNEKFAHETIITRCFEILSCPVIFDVRFQHGESLNISQNAMNGRTDWIEVLYRKVGK